MSWGYVREEAVKITAGDQRVVITDVEETTSKANNPMIVVSVKPNLSNITIKHYIVKNQYFNRNMTDLFDSFTQIKEGDFNFLGWIGCVGAARLKEDENGYLKVAYFIDAKRAEKLPPWQGELPERQEVTSFETLDDDDDLPFL